MGRGCSLLRTKHRGYSKDGGQNRKSDSDGVQRSAALCGYDTKVEEISAAKSKVNVNYKLSSYAVYCIPYFLLINNSLRFTVVNSSIIHPQASAHIFFFIIINVIISLINLIKKTT